MKKNLFFYLTFFAFIFSEKYYSQTYQLQGNPVNTAGWALVGPAIVNTDFVQLTPDLTNQSGSIRLNDPINLKYCDKWRVEFDFQMTSTNTSTGDGLAFWYLANPPVASVLGSGLGVSQNAVGLVVGFDTYNNTTTAGMSKVHVGYGQIQNTTDSNNIEYFNTPGSSFHSANLNPAQSFHGTTYKHVEVSAEVDPTAPTSWIIQIKIDGTVICNQAFAPSGAATTMTTGFFGFSASTGSATSRHTIKNVKIYTDKVNLLQPNVIHSTCPNPNTGQGMVDLTTFNSQFVANPSNYTFNYSVAGTPISNPSNYQFSNNTTVNIRVKDNASILCDNPDGTIQLSLSPFTANNVTIAECNNNEASATVFNLNNAVVTTQAGITKKYYKTLADLNAGVNEITNPGQYVSGPGKVYVKITTPQGCTGNAEITLAFHPLADVKDTTLESCFIIGNSSFGEFDLASASITEATDIIKRFYPSLDDALNNTNEITATSKYISTSRVVFVKVIGLNSCFIIRKITLKVLPPVSSSVLKDKIICIDERTNLDAGGGFDSYLWNTGATTQSIQGVPPGRYSVLLQTGQCYTLQTVDVKIAQAPVITDIEIKNNSVTVNVSGGKAPYQFSKDGINWQDSNVFNNLPRGENKFFVKDSYNCDPVQIQITVPNLINAITPNGDNVNDMIDYTALAYKKNVVLTVYDRYGNLKYEANKIRNYKWDGTSAGKKLPTGTYWYTITWSENDKNNTSVQYHGWVLLKNRD